MIFVFGRNLSKFLSYPNTDIYAVPVPIIQMEPTTASKLLNILVVRHPSSHQEIVSLIPTQSMPVNFFIQHLGHTLSIRVYPCWDKTKIHSKVLENHKAYLKIIFIYFYFKYM